MHDQSPDVKAPAETWSGYLSLREPERTLGLITPDVVYGLVRLAALPSLAQRIERQNFTVPAPTLALPREPTLTPVKVAPPKRTLAPEQPTFLEPPYRPGLLGKLIPKIGRITHAGFVRQAREVHARRSPSGSCGARRPRGRTRPRSAPISSASVPIPWWHYTGRCSKSISER